MNVRARGVSELRTVLHYLFKNCYLIQYFVGTSETLLVQTWSYKLHGTNDILVGLHVPTDFKKCTDKTPKKHYWGNPPPPPLATLVLISALRRLPKCIFFC